MGVGWLVDAYGVINNEGGMIGVACGVSNNAILVASNKQIAGRRGSKLDANSSPKY